MSDLAPRHHHPPLSNARSVRVVVVGPCASGKTTLVDALCSLGYDAHVCSQEHSEIATLWRRSQPDVLIALNVDIGAVHRRRGSHWLEWLHDVQIRRLAGAYESADLVIDTSTLDSRAVLDNVVAYLEARARN